jgi:hypothetical protein
MDGERLGAVYGIERILVAAGLSFHDLAKAVLGSTLVVDKNDTSKDWIEAGKRLLAEEKLSAKERQFVDDIVNRLISNPAYVLSEKQVGWFVSLYRREIKVPKAKAA